MSILNVIKEKKSTGFLIIASDNRKTCKFYLPEMNHKFVKYHLKSLGYDLKDTKIIVKEG